MFKDVDGEEHLLCDRCKLDITEEKSRPEQYFMVKDELWNEVCDANGINREDVLCLDCFEKLLGREIIPSDLATWEEGNPFGYPPGSMVPVNFNIISARNWWKECEQSLASYSECFEDKMTVDGKSIIITDPCYIVKTSEDWDKSDCGERMDLLGFTNYISESTIYGDWSCSTYKVSGGAKEHLDQVNICCRNMTGEEHTEDNTAALEHLASEEEYIGSFCADAGMVGVFLLDEVLAYNPEFAKFMEEHKFAVTKIDNFEGEITYYVDEETEAHIIGEGNVNFFTIQTGF